jgi:putative transposase
VFSPKDPLSAFCIPAQRGSRPSFPKREVYRFQTAEIREEAIKEVEEFIRVDLGLTEIATLSNGKIVSSEKLTAYREKRQKIRSSHQSKCTNNARRVLKRISGRERTTARIINHTLSKQIVAIAKTEGKGIAIENLKGIRFCAGKNGRKMRSRLGKWNFNRPGLYLKAHPTLADGLFAQYSRLVQAID